MSPTSLTRNPNLTFIPESHASVNEVQSRFSSGWWTGLPPNLCPGFNSQTQTFHALPLLNLSLCSRQDVLDYFDNTWTMTELLFAGLKSDSAFFRAPYHQLRHPLIFYYGHPAVLFVNKLRLAGILEKPIDLYLEKVLETGVDEMSWDDMAKNDMIWPSVEDVHSYRKKVYAQIKTCILESKDLESTKDFSQSLEKSPLWALWMGFEHEKIHIETTSVLMRELPLELVETPKYFANLHPSAFSKQVQKAPEISWQKQSAQSVKIGKPKDTPTYGWDNEYGERTIEIKEFQYSENLISNAEYFDFVKSGCYSQDQYWKPEGLLWRKYRNTKRPTFWMAVGPEGLHEYKLRTIFAAIDMPWSWPAEVNFHEAQAYCRWKQEKDASRLQYRLLTEAEFYSLLNHQTATAAKKDEVLQEIHFKNSRPQEITSNFNFKFSSASPVNSSIMGNVWQWVEDQFNPLNDFKTHPYYDDFSTPCFDGKHQMIKGGSFASCGHEASIYARFHFRPHFYQHSGFRIAASLDGSADNGAFKIQKDLEYVHPTRTSALDQMKQPEWWKNIQQPLHLSPAESEFYFNTAKERVFKFLNEFANMKASGEGHSKVPYQASLDFPARSTSMDSLLKTIFEDLVPQSQLPGHPSYAAYLAGSSNLVSSLAQLISTTINPFSGHYSFAPGLVQLEAETIKWFINLFGYPENTALGFFTSGGSYANLSALSIARKAKLKPEEFSLARVYASDQSHHCIGKALAILGFRDDALVIIETDDRFKMDTNLLEKQIQKDLQQGLKPLAIVGTAGTTNTGSIDPLNSISAIAKSHDLWFHVDGAFGALFQLTEAGKENLSGIGKSDSISFDPHKSMSMPYGTGALLVRDRMNLLYKYQGSKTYMPEENFFDESGLKVDYSEISPELSREWRGLKVWLPLKVFGVGPFILNLEEKLQLTRWCYSEISKVSALNFVTKPELTVQAFRLNSPALQTPEREDQATEVLLQKINESGTLFLSGCRLRKRRYIRVSLLSHQMHFEQVEKFTKALPALVDATLREFGQK